VNIFAEQNNCVPMETLKELLNQITSSEKFTDDNRQTIAEKLLRDYCIKKGDLLYDILEIEFYYFDKEHPDIITYPRTAEAGDWFIHQSGVDLCFKSTIVRCSQSRIEEHIELEKGKIDSLHSCFGGILIRAIRRQSDGVIFLGPLNAYDELLGDSSVQRLSCVAKDKASNQIKINKIWSYMRYFNFDAETKKIIKSNDYIANESVALCIKSDAKYRYFVEDIKDISFQKLRNYLSRVKLNNQTNTPESRL
jgi:hypothetical protein